MLTQLGVSTGNAAVISVYTGLDTVQKIKTNKHTVGDSYEGGSIWDLCAVQCYTETHSC